jgi:hypothetical protein
LPRGQNIIRVPIDIGFLMYAHRFNVSFTAMIVA